LKPENKLKIIVLFIDLMIIVSFILLWEQLVNYKVLDPLFTPSPSTLLKSSGFIYSQRFINALIDSLYPCVLGITLGLLAGLGVGIFIGAIPPLREAIFVYLNIVQMSPKIIFLPIFTLLFKTGMLSKTLFIALHMFLVICITVISALSGVKQIYVNVAKVMGASRLQIFREVVFPYISPILFGGFRVGVAASFVASLAYELLLGGGIGGLVSLYAMKLMPEYVYLATISFGIFCAIINGTLILMERKISSWR